MFLDGIFFGNRTPWQNSGYEQLNNLIRITKTVRISFALKQIFLEAVVRRCSSK